MHQLGRIHAGSFGVEHQQVNLGHVRTEFLCCLPIVCLEHMVATHPQKAGDRLEQGVVVADNDARPSMGGGGWWGRHWGNLESGGDGRPWREEGASNSNVPP